MSYDPKTSCCDKCNRYADEYQNCRTCECHQTTPHTDAQKCCKLCPLKYKKGAGVTHCTNKPDCPCHNPHTPSLEIGEQTDFSETNTTAIAFLQKCLENGHRLRIDDIEITEYKQERVVSLKPNPAFIRTEIANARREESTRVIEAARHLLRKHAQRLVDGDFRAIMQGLQALTNKES